VTGETAALLARGTDERVHLVDAGQEALLDPSPHRGRCGSPLIEVYNDRPEVTCPVCAETRSG
jgi:hypothetical protein